jgi:hypothetical protein
MIQIFNVILNDKTVFELISNYYISIDSLFMFLCILNDTVFFRVILGLAYYIDMKFILVGVSYSLNILPIESGYDVLTLIHSMFAVILTETIDSNLFIN